MRLLGRNKLAALRGRDETMDKWISGWVSEVIHAQWHGRADVFHQFPKTQDRGQGIYFFQSISDDYGIEALIEFQQGIVLITELTKFAEDSSGH